MEPEAINQAVAAFAKQEVRRVIAEGIASPQYERYVNSVRGAPEEAYKAPGSIVYEFTNWPLVINSALEDLRKRVPVRSGRYRDGFTVVVGGRVVVTDFMKLRSDAEVVIFNPRPYTRRMEVGANKTGARHFDGAKRVLSRRFSGAFSVELRFVNVPGGVHPLAPYRLKRGQGRKGRAAGDQITYPALIINPVN
nr:hypothetical protein [Mesorhizobium sp.]